MSGYRQPSTGDWVRIMHAALRRKARREADPQGAAPRLVLNLSLGWSHIEGPSTDTRHGPAAALVAAMNYAACNEVLMVVAAGNTGVQMGGWYNRPIDSIEEFIASRTQFSSSWILAWMRSR